MVFPPRKQTNKKTEDLKRVEYKYLFPSKELMESMRIIS